MATMVVRIPVALTFPEATRDVELEAATVGEALQSLANREAGLRQRLLGSDGRLLVGIFLNGKDTRRLEGLQTRLADGDAVSLVLPIAGG